MAAATPPAPPATLPPPSPPPPPPLPPVAPFGVSRSELTALNDAKDMDALRNQYGGADGLAAALCSDLQYGITTHEPDASATAGTAAAAAAPLPPPDEAGGVGRKAPTAATDQKRYGANGGGDGSGWAAPTLAQRVEVFGANQLAPVPLKSLLALIWDNLQDPILLLLIAAALVSTVLGAAIPEQRRESGWVEGVAIWVAIAVVVLVSSFNDYSKDRQFAALNRRRDLTDVTVLRDGAETRIPNTQVVAGDVLVVSAGDKVTADGLLAVPGLDRGGLMAVDESSLTGESEAVKKSLEEDPWVRCGTQVQEGGGRVLVLAVGGDTEYGRTMAIVGEAGGQDTPLTEKLGDLAGAIGKIGGAAAVVLFIVLLVIWIVKHRGFPIAKINDHGPVQFFLYCVTIVVVAVPEGLPLAVTISLAYSMRQMMDDQCFVRVLEACETLGGCTAICSDKTGTLTQNRMTVVEGWAAPGNKFDRAPLASELPEPLLEDLHLNIALNSKAFLVEPPPLQHQHQQHHSSPGHDQRRRHAASDGKQQQQQKSTPAVPAVPAVPASLRGLQQQQQQQQQLADSPQGVEEVRDSENRDLDLELGERRTSTAVAAPPPPVPEEPGGRAVSRCCLGVWSRLLGQGRRDGGDGGDGGGSVRSGGGDGGTEGGGAAAGGGGGASPPPRTVFVGNRTEGALLALMDYGWGVRRYGEVRRQYEGALEHVYGFTSERKMSSVVLRLPGGRLRLYNKGAAEWVLRACTAVQAADGLGAVPLDEQWRAELGALVDEMAGRGLRCIALAARDLDPDPDPSTAGGRPPGYWDEPPLENMVLQALLGIKDPLRPEVPQAVATCQQAGITVRMVTGDNVNTARFIARECGILTDGGTALEGPAFRALSDEQLAAALPRLQVLARSSPADKFRLVSALRARREVVAVTGDGTNDAPALKESDVGLAMGITGTEVAKEAADIVVLDDNFSSIVKAVMWGRTVFENIRKFVAFQLTVNIVALVVAFVGAIAGGREPLTVLQLLWVNLIMDTLAALALATERPDPLILTRKPYGRHEHLITGTMLRYMLSQAAYQIAVLFFMLYALPVVIPGRYGSTADPDHVRSLSLLFNTFIFCQASHTVRGRW
ncbi:hypothetical protein PLESTF_000409400 [Pleodorina starrii]|nr:hypothetical protein PLESTM_001450900 [Pleodorina starrii]GLC66302.1 hypothetical protein PLESTF_000409400 [Pleodorina starrii]